jgi:hypothetical protein
MPAPRICLRCPAFAVKIGQAENGSGRLCHSRGKRRGIGAALSSVMMVRDTIAAIFLGTVQSNVRLRNHVGRGGGVQGESADADADCDGA